MNRRELLWAGAVASMAGVGRASVITTRADAEEAPALPVEAAESETLWLNWNENPLGLAPAARRAVSAAIGRANRYPDLARAELATALAARHRVEPENIVLGCGSTQVLQTIVLAAQSPGAPLVLAEPTFEAVLRYQQPLSYRVARTALDSRFAHDLQRMREQAGRGPAVVYLCNPNNPTATLTPSADIDAWIEEAPETVLFGVDEAYFEYVQDPRYWSADKWVRERPNVVVTRTFSKMYGMAGLRLGYAVAHAQTARRLRAFMSQDNVNGPALAAAMACLADQDLVPRGRASNRRARKIVHECLDELGLDFLPSHANFLMHRVAGDLESYVRRMRERGIRVGRPFPPLSSYNRLSLGLPNQMARWADTLRDFRRRGWV